MAQRIEEMFAFVAVENGSEGVVAADMGGKWYPLTGADMARVESLRPLAQDIARATGKEIRLLKFSVREELEVFR